jgi:hypothetical protein
MSKKEPSEASKKPMDKDGPNATGDIPGLPGYRTRDGRSGLDPVDSGTEAGHTLGTYIQKLFTGQLKVNNPIYLIFIGFLGLALITPLILAILEMVNGNPFSWGVCLFLSITGMIGLAVLFTFIKNLIRIIK